MPQPCQSSWRQKISLWVCKMGCKSQSHDQLQYVCHHNLLLIRNRSWILTIHKGRIFRKNVLKSKEMVYKNGLKNTSRCIYLFQVRWRTEEKWLMQAYWRTPPSLPMVSITIHFKFEWTIDRQSFRQSYRDQVVKL